MGGPLSFEVRTLIGLEASPYRMLAIENLSEDQIVDELLAIASEWPKRTKLEVRRYGQGTPKLRADLISIALGKTLKTLREHLVTDGGRDLYFFTERARLLRLAGERAGGVDEDLVARG